MPKESKRFINPLLRPTVEVETKREEVQTTQPERPVSPEKTSTVTFTTTSEEISIVPQVVEPHPPAVKPVAHPFTDTSTFQEETRQAELSSKREFPRPVQEAPVEIPQTPLEGENLAFSTSSVPPNYRGEQATIPGWVPSIDRAESSTAMLPSTMQLSSFPPTSHAVEWASPLTTLPDPSPLPPTSTYTATEHNVSSAHVQHNEVVEHEHYSAPPPSRRRRGAQAFEKTHERITLWIDKRLKQAFEELAYEQEISKTALLNEAMADLLNKYTSR